MKRKGFTLVELLATVVILALLMLTAGTAVLNIMTNTQVNTFKNDTSVILNSAESFYAAVASNPAAYGAFIKQSADSTASGLCVTLAGLFNNGYLEKDIKHMAGVILVEVPNSNGKPAGTIWIHNSKFGINGVERTHIAELKFHKENNSAPRPESVDAANIGIDTTDISGGNLGIVTNLIGIKKLVSAAYGTTNLNFVGNDPNIQNTTLQDYEDSTEHQC